MTHTPAGMPLDMHRQLLALWSAADALPPAQTIAGMEALRGGVLACLSLSALLSWERYLELLCLRLGRPDLKPRLTLLDPDACERALLRDPSRGDLMLVAALAGLHGGRGRRAHQLLTRLAASRLPERGRAQELLAELATGTAPGAAAAGTVSGPGAGPVSAPDAAPVSDPGSGLATGVAA